MVVAAIRWKRTEDEWRPALTLMRNAEMRNEELPNHIALGFVKMQRFLWSRR